MPEPVVIMFHNPRCSKSRQTLKLLEDKQIAPRIVRYLDNPPTVTELDNILRKLDLEPRDLMRKKEASYEDNELDNPKLSRRELIKAMVDHPILIERPVVLANNKAAVGRPPENVLKII